MITLSDYKPYAATIDPKVVQLFESPDPQPARHCAKYTKELLPHMGAMMTGCQNIIDPFAGVGGIFQVLEYMPPLFHGYPQVAAIELEPEWAVADPRIQIGNALNLSYPDNYFDGACTSPPYGNRMADRYRKNHRDRNTYAACLNRDLTKGNIGGMQWGKVYRFTMVQAWIELHRVLQVGAPFVLNMKNHYRKKALQHVTEWHMCAICSLGFEYVNRVDVQVKGNKRGQNGSARADYESVIEFRKAKA